MMLELRYRVVLLKFQLNMTSKRKYISAKIVCQSNRESIEKDKKKTEGNPKMLSEEVLGW